MLSGISPTIARLQLRDLHSSGTIVGRLSAWATAGALTGTFGTGFVLVPLLPVSTSVLAIGIMLIVVGFALGAYTGVFHRRTGAATVSLTVALALLTLAQHSPCQAETAYNCVQVETFPQQPAVKVLLLDRGYNSDVDPSDPSYLGFSYERWLSEAIAGLGRPGTPLDGVFVGGGGFTMSRWLQATRSGSRSNTLEVDGGLVQFDRQHLRAAHLARPARHRRRRSRNDATRTHRQRQRHCRRRLQQPHRAVAVDDHPMACTKSSASCGPAACTRST